MKSTAKVYNQSTTGTAIYKPRPSNGWVWVGAIGLSLLAIAVILAGIISSAGSLSILTYLPAVVIGLIGTAFILLAAWFPTMRYEIKEGRLSLRYGPLQLYQIELRHVQKMRKCDLEYSPVSSLRFPGLALYKVHYPEVGVVNMCSTSAFHSILLIETPKVKFGITPADEASFVTMMHKSLEA